MLLKRTEIKNICCFQFKEHLGIISSLYDALHLTHPPLACIHVARSSSNTSVIPQIKNVFKRKEIKIKGIAF